WLMTFSVITIALGLFIMVTPGLALKVLMIVLGIWALLVGVYQLYSHFTTARENRKGSLGLSIALIAILLGLIMVFRPFPVSMLMTILTGIISVIVGIMLIGRSFRTGKLTS
ncbi:MAG TPA: DUF308 domain-containing protein, partial [Bacteroidales bacterium]|nr:DUF308 domain-containing protein [Bacteroidales bacterium]